MNRVLVIGSTGMIGSAVFQELSFTGIDAVEASRTKGLKFDARTGNCESLLSLAKAAEVNYIVNCVGVTKARIDETSTASVIRSIDLNTVFPNQLALAAENHGIRVIQVATDCVFSGAQGRYCESSHHDARDVYGKTKSLGEAPSGAVMHLRCSVIGPELGRNSLFFEWVKNQPEGATIQGYSDHVWNGLTSNTFGRIVSGIVKEGLFAAGVQHVVPGDVVSKRELIELELEALGRSDIVVEPVHTGHGVDRSLSTSHPSKNETLFEAAGYPSPPTISEMLKNLCA